MPTNRTTLMNLAAKEFRRGSDQPAPPVTRKSFKGWRLSLAKYGQGWDRKRGAAMRLTGVLLNEDSAALQARVCADERATETYDAAADWLAGEAQVLRKAVRMHETAATRLRTVIERCRAVRASPDSQALA